MYYYAFSLCIQLSFNHASLVNQTPKPNVTICKGWKQTHYINIIVKINNTSGFLDSRYG